MLKEIKFTTLQNQGQSLNEYSRSLTPEQRLQLLNELNKQAFWRELSENRIPNKEIAVFTKNENESLPEFFARARRRNT